MPDWKKYRKKSIFFIASLFVSFFFCIIFQPFLNEKALDLLVNIYSILAGFLIGVIALIGDPSSLPKGSWRIAESSSRNVYRNLQGTRNLLSIYLLTLFLIFMYKLLSVNGVEALFHSNNLTFVKKSTLQTIKVWSEMGILFLSFMAFSYSFKLPAKLFSIQQQRVNKEIESRRKKANIKIN